MKRRAFLKLGAGGAFVAAAAASGIVWVPRVRAATIERTYYINDGFVRQPDGANVYFKGFSDSAGALKLPGRALIVQEGDLVRIRVINGLTKPHSFFVADLCDSGPIAAGESRVIEFTASKVGSHLFYDNLNPPYNRLLGLHGGLAVMPSGRGDQLYAGSPTFKKQRFWIFNDIDPVWHQELRYGRTPTTPFTPRYFTINGLSSRPPDAPDYDNPDINAFYNPDTHLHGRIGDRTLIRVFNAGLCEHSMHWHGNHVEWLTENGQARPAVWRKDTLRLRNNIGALDVIYPFKAPVDAYPPVTTGHYVMHLHDEQTQTAGGGLYQFGAATHITFE